MSNKVVSLLTVAVASVAIGNVQAHEAYGGINLGFVEYSLDDVFDDEASLDGIYGRLGAQLNENISMEIRAGFGIDDDTVRVSGTDVEVDLDNLFGAYLRGGFPVTEVFYPYAVIGYTRVEVDYTIPGIGNGDGSDSDVSLGFGVDVNLDQNLAVNLEYMKWYDDDDAEIDGVAVGVMARF